jgi:tRNA(fMet)-specific endonuclease VapC
MYRLDTDTLGHLHQGHPGVIRQLAEVGDSDVGTTIVSRIEILRGRFEYFLKARDGQDVLKAQERLLSSEQALSQVTIVPFDESAAQQFDLLCRQRNLKKIGRRDILIASIVLGRRATLVTRNLRHFRAIRNLRIENWVD